MAQDLEFRDFVEGRWHSFVRTAFLLTGDHGHAEDLVQSALEKVHRHRGRVQHMESPDAYTRRAIVNLSTSWHRRRRVIDVPVEVLPDAPAWPPAQERADELWAALRALPPRMRASLRSPACWGARWLGQEPGVAWTCPAARTRSRCSAAAFNPDHPGFGGSPMSTPLEQDLKLLAARAEELPYIDDPWRRFSALEATHRRRRRAGFATGALCAALAVGGLGSGVLPLPAWTPAVTVDPGWASTPLLDGGIRGGMTHAWVTNCRHRLEGTRHST